MKEIKKDALIAVGTELNEKLNAEPKFEWKKKATKTEIVDDVFNFLKDEPLTKKDSEELSVETMEVIELIFDHKGETLVIEEPKAKKKATKSTKTKFGHVLNCQGGRIDQLLLSGAAKTVKEIAEEVGARVARAQDHLRVLANEKGVAYDEEQLSKNVYQIAEINGEPFEVK